jgi:hypothetical protein
VVAQLGEGAVGIDTVPKIANQTLTAIGNRFGALASDPCVQEAFIFLVDLAGSAIPRGADHSLLNRTSLQLAAELNQRLLTIVGSLETKAIAQRATADALTTWQRERPAQSRDLFEKKNTATLWRALGSGAGFCEISRLFFAKFTERYLSYFLDREASAALPDLASREAFRRNLSTHVSEISKHAFETSKITQSFAAGWFNKYASSGAPTRQQVKKFLAYAFEKVREEFRREEGR